MLPPLVEVHVEFRWPGSLAEPPPRVAIWCKISDDLRAENPRTVFSVADGSAIRLPAGGLKTNYLIAREDYFFVYPTKLREYQARYRDSFLHGGISPDEMILPVALLKPRGEAR